MRNDGTDQPVTFVALVFRDKSGFLAVEAEYGVAYQFSNDLRTTTGNHMMYQPLIAAELSNFGQGLFRKMNDIDDASKNTQNGNYVSIFCLSQVKVRDKNMSESGTRRRRCIGIS